MIWLSAARHAGKTLQPRALDTNQAVGNQVEIVKIHAATAVAMTNQGNPDKASTQFQAGLELAEQCGYPGGRVCGARSPAP